MPATNHRFITGLNIFFILHMLMHLLYLLHKKNDFKEGKSWLAIAGNGILALLIP